MAIFPRAALFHFALVASVSQAAIAQDAANAVAAGAGEPLQASAEVNPPAASPITALADGAQADKPAAGPPRPTYEPTLSSAVDVRRGLPLLDWGQAPVAVPAKLIEAINQTTQRNPSALSAWYAVRAAHADLRGVKWRNFPTLSGQLNTWSAGAYKTTPSVQVNMPLYTFGRNRADLARAKAGQGSQVASWRQRVLDLALATSQAYYQFLSSDVRANILAVGEDQHQSLVRSMERRVTQGVSPLADLELARTRLGQMQQDLSVSRAQRSLALNTLRDLVQDGAFEPGPAPAYAPDAYPSTWEAPDAQAIEYAPAREQLSRQAEEAGAYVSAVKASIFPEVYAGYSYDRFYGSRAGLGVRLQSAAGLSQISQIEAAQTRYSQALNKITELEHQVRQDVTGQVIQYQAARDRTAISLLSQGSAGRVSESYVRQFIAGRRSWLDLMNAIRENVSAQLSDADAQFTVMALNSQLSLKTGLWQPQLQEED